MVSKTKRHPKPGLSAPPMLPTSIPVLHPHPRRSQGTGTERSGWALGLPLVPAPQPCWGRPRHSSKDKTAAFLAQSTTDPGRPQSPSPLSGWIPSWVNADHEVREVFPLGTSSQPDPTQHANTVGIIYQESHKHLQPRPVHFLDY